MSALNPFSSQEKQHFPEFSPMFNKKTPTSSEKKSSFRWSIDQLAILKPAEIDTDDDTLGITNKDSPDNDERQKQIDVYFAKTILPSPWPTVPKAKLSKRVTFSPTPPPPPPPPPPPASTDPFLQKSLVESQVRDSKTADVGTQTTLTLPMTFDLESLFSALCHAHSNTAKWERGEDVDDDIIGNSSLRRKLFGQPDRQESSCNVSSEDMVISNDTSPCLPTTPFSMKQSLYPTQGVTPLHRGTSRSPAIVLTHPVLSHTPSSFNSDKSDHSPLRSSLVLHTPGGHFSVLSPINERGRVSKCGEEMVISGEEGTLDVPQDQLHLVSPLGPPADLRTCRVQEGAGSGVCGVTAIAKCTSTPNTATKRKLGPSPFASPVLGAIDDDDDEEHCQGLPTTPHHCRTLSPRSKEIASLSETSGVQPLCLADLCTQTSDFTNVTSTTCTGYFNAMCLEDSERDTIGADPIENRLHPLHSTAHPAHLGSTQLSNWHQTPVHLPTPEADSHNWNQNVPKISGMSHIHTSVSGTRMCQSSGMDSGVGGSTEFTVSSILTSSDRTGEKCPVSSKPPSSQHVASTQSTKMVDGFVVPKSTSSNTCKNNHLGRQLTLTTIPEGVASLPSHGEGVVTDSLPKEELLSPKQGVVSPSSKESALLSRGGHASSFPLKQGLPSDSPSSEIEGQGTALCSAVDSGLVCDGEQSDWTLASTHHHHHHQDAITGDGLSPAATTTSANPTHIRTTSNAIAIPSTTKEITSTGALLYEDRSPDCVYGSYPISRTSYSFPSESARPYHWKSSPSSVHSYATPTSAYRHRKYRRSPRDGTRRATKSADVTPRRYCKSTCVALRSSNGVGCPPSLFTDALLKRKEMVKARLQFKNSPPTKSPYSSLSYLKRLRTPLQRSPSSYAQFHAPSIHLYNKKCGVLATPLVTPLPSSPVSNLWKSPCTHSARSGIGERDKENFASTPVTPSSHHTRLKTLYNF